MTWRNKLSMLLVLVLTVVTVAEAGTWYTSRLMRNPGLTKYTATTTQQCINICNYFSNCTAVSYQQDTGVCFISSCNSLDLFGTSGWNTYISDGAFVEGRDFPAVQFEWMLTSNCGSGNQGAQAGPAMQVSNSIISNLSPAVSAYVTSAARLTSTTVKSSQDSRLYNSMGSTSLSITFWMYATEYSGLKALFEFSYNNLGGSGPYVYVTSGKVSFYIPEASLSTYYPLGSNPTQLNDGYWHHVACVYDGQNSLTKVYVNGNLVTGSVGTSNSVNYIWNTVTLGYSQSVNYYFDGYIYCVRVFNKTLSIQQVNALMTSCYKIKARFSN